MRTNILISAVVAVVGVVALPAQLSEALPHSHIYSPVSSTASGWDAFRTNTMEQGPGPVIPTGMPSVIQPVGAVKKSTTDSEVCIGDCHAGAAGEEFKTTGTPAEDILPPKCGNSICTEEEISAVAEANEDRPEPRGLPSSDGGPPQCSPGDLHCRPLDAPPAIVAAREAGQFCIYNPLIKKWECNVIPGGPPLVESAEVAPPPGDDEDSLQSRACRYDNVKMTWDCYNGQPPHCNPKTGSCDPFPPQANVARRAAVASVATAAAAAAVTFPPYYAIYPLPPVHARDEQLSCDASGCHPPRCPGPTCPKIRSEEQDSQASMPPPPTASKPVMLRCVDGRCWLFSPEEERRAEAVEASGRVVEASERVVEANATLPANATMPAAEEVEGVDFVMRHVHDIAKRQFDLDTGGYEFCHPDGMFGNAMWDETDQTVIRCSCCDCRKVDCGRHPDLCASPVHCNGSGHDPQCIYYCPRVYNLDGTFRNPPLKQSPG